MKNVKFILIFGSVFAIICLLWLVAHIFQAYPWHGIFTISDPDSLLFARLLEQSVLKGHILKTDNYGCFPYEITHGLAPMYFAALYYFVAAFFTVLPNCGYDPTLIAGTLPIVFTWVLYICILITVWLCSKNKSLTVICAACMLPGVGSGMLSGLMKLDYDWAISMCIWLWLCFYCLYIVYKNSLFTLAGGLVSALLIGIWTGNPLFFFICTMYGIYVFIKEREDCCEYFEYAYSTMLIGALLNAVYIVKFGLPAEQFIITKYSWFQVACCLVGGLFFYGLFQLKQKENNRRNSYFFIFASCAFVAVLFFPIIKESSGLLAKKDPIHATIGELVPFYDLSLMNIDGKLVTNVVSSLGWSGVFLPVFVFLSPLGFKKQAGHTLKDWSVCFILMAMYQARFIRWSGIGLGLFAGIVLYCLWKYLFEQTRQKSLTKFGLMAIIVILLLSHISQSYSFIRGIHGAEPNALEAYAWLNRNTPETSGYKDNNKPEYGILAYWDYGDHINYYAKRPTIVNNAMWGYRTMAEIFCSKNEKEAYELCNEYKVKYIFFNPSRVYGPIQGFWPYFKDKPKKPEYKLVTEDIKFAKDYNEYFWTWLHENLAITARHSFKPADHFRLVYVGNTNKNQHVFPYVIIEVVKGSILNIDADPKTEVSVSLSIKLDGIDYLYKKKQVTDDKGKAMFTLPYSTNHSGGRIRTDDIYKISYLKNGNLVKAKLSVSNDDVMNGKEVIQGL